MTLEEQIDFVQQVLNMNTLTYRTVTPTVDAMNNILASLKELKAIKEETKKQPCQRCDIERRCINGKTYMWDSNGSHIGKCHCHCHCHF